MTHSFGAFNSIALLASGIVGGLGSTAGAVIGGLLQAGGASFVTGLPFLNELADPGDAGGILLGVLLLVQVIAFPSGLSRPLLRAEAVAARWMQSLRGRAAAPAEAAQ